MYKAFFYKYSFKDTFPYLLLLLLSFLQVFVFLNYGEGLSTQALFLFSTFLFHVALAQLSQRLLKVFLVFSLLVCVIIYPVFFIYGEPDFSFVASLYYTSPGESYSYMKVVPTKVYVQIGLLIAFYIYLLKLDYKKIESPLKYVLFVVLIAFPVKKLFSYGYVPMYIDRYFNVLPVKRTTYFTYQFSEVKKENDFVKQQSSLASTWAIGNSDSLKLADYFVVVVGESVRRDFMNAYGFSIENTPFISSSPRIQFQDFISASSHTVPSLTRMMTLSENGNDYEINNNMVNLGKEIGYSTYWISNQEQVGYHDSPTSAIAYYSDDTHFLRQKNFWQGEVFDTEMLPIFNSIIEQEKDQPQLIFLHTIGSHGSACDRTGGAYDVYFLTNEVSCYIESIKNTDALLAQLYENLKQTNKSFKLVYFSDHGETLHPDYTLSHGGKYKQNFEIPLLVWGDDIEET